MSIIKTSATSHNFTVQADKDNASCISFSKVSIESMDFSVESKTHQDIARLKARSLSSQVISDDTGPPRSNRAQFIYSGMAACVIIITSQLSLKLIWTDFVGDTS